MRIWGLLVAGLLILYSCSSKENKKVEEKIEKVKVELYKVAKVETQDVYEVSGSVVSKNPVDIVSKTMGTVVQVNVNEGDRVSKGKLLIQIDSPEIKAMVERAEASIEEAKKALATAKANERLAENTFKRYENLFKEQAISRQEYEVKETNYLIAKGEVERLENLVKQAEAEKARIKGMESYLYIYSPVSGVVTKKHVNNGVNVLPGMQLITIEPEDNLRIEVNADEKVLGVIKKGMIVPVFIDILKKELKGVVSEFVPAIDTQTRTFKLKVDLPKDKNLAIGLYGTVKINIGKKPTIYVPKSAIYTREQLNYVYVVGSDKKVVLRFVRIGKEIDNNVEILSGLNEGEEIVKNINENVKEGVVVE
jgi:multidrug efflux system membrane fusion protein